MGVVFGAALSSTNVQPDSLIKGVRGPVTVTFTTATAIPIDGKIKVTFPAGFDVSNVGVDAGWGCSTMDGLISASHSGQTAVLTRSGGTQTSQLP